MNIKFINRNLSQLRGYHTYRKIVVIESDDWGSIRTRSDYDKQKLLSIFPNLSKDSYFNLDTLETSDDLNALFEVLKSVQNSTGQNPIITANTIVANPDFKKIRESNFNEYFYEPFSKTLKDRDGNHGVLDLIKTGDIEGFFKPQLHGREHLSVHQWFNAIQNGHFELLTAFEHDMFGIQLNQEINKRHNVMAALDFDDFTHLYSHREILNEAQAIFKATFGYESKTFIAPSYIWHPSHEVILKEIGISALQGLPYQYIPHDKGGVFKTNVRYTGMKSKDGLLNLVRNVFFEPSLIKNGQESVNHCIKRIDFAFKTFKPAIIGSHRLNFMGSLVEKNRTENLKNFKVLLKKIVEKWPDVEFMSSDQLALQINNY